MKVYCKQSMRHINLLRAKELIENHKTSGNRQRWGLKSCELLTHGHEMREAQCNWASPLLLPCYMWLTPISDYRICHKNQITLLRALQGQRKRIEGCFHPCRFWCSTYWLSSSDLHLLTTCSFGSWIFLAACPFWCILQGQKLCKWAQLHQSDALSCSQPMWDIHSSHTALWLGVPIEIVPLQCLGDVSSLPARWDGFAQLGHEKGSGAVEQIHPLP